MNDFYKGGPELWMRWQGYNGHGITLRVVGYFGSDSTGSCGGLDRMGNHRPSEVGAAVTDTSQG